MSMLSRQRPHHKKRLAMRASQRNLPLWSAAHHRPHPQMPPRHNEVRKARGIAQRCMKGSLSAALTLCCQAVQLPVI